MTDKCSTCGHYHKSDNDTKVCTLLSCMCDITKFQPIIETKSLDYYQQVISQMETNQEKIEYLLKEIPEFRNYTNKEFVFAFWHYNFGYVPPLDVYIKLTDPETIRRCKQKVVEQNPTLNASEKLNHKKSIKKGAIEEWVIQ